MRKLVFFTCLFVIHLITHTEGKGTKWNLINNDGIEWKIGNNLPHADHIEMSGKFMSSVIRYGVRKDKSFHFSRNLVWPMLRTIPNDTHASLTRAFNIDVVKCLNIDEENVKKEIVKRVSLDGKLTVSCQLTKEIHIVHTHSPSVDLPVFCEKYVLTNKGDKNRTIEIPQIHKTINTKKEDGVEGSYQLDFETVGAATINLKPGESYPFYVTIRGNYFKSVDVEQELNKRTVFVNQLWNKLVLNTPDKVLNCAFAFAKIRASESIYQTKDGPMHSPGGLHYYAAIWANDQAEYINPFFSYLGYSYGAESAINSYRHFARFMNDEYKFLPSSIIAEELMSGTAKEIEEMQQ